MYKFFVSILFTIIAGFAVKAQEFTYNWGPADTVECHTVGPGMTYAKIIFPDKPLILWWVDIDLKNPYAKVEQVQSRHSVPDVKRWDVMTHYRENSRPNHRVRVAWNHDFFSYEDGICIGINISEGEMTWNKWGRSLLAITDKGDAEIFYPAMDAHIETPDGTCVEIDYFNAYETGVGGDCVLYNRFNSKTLTETGRYIALSPLDEWIVNGAEPIRCRVEQISDAPIQTAPNRYVLYLRNWKIAALEGHVAVGDVIAVTQKFNHAGFGTPPQRILNAFHGYPSIVRNGVLHDGEFNDFENGREYEKSSRVMAGISQDKTHLYIATTELSPKSVGVDCIELTAWMVEHGAWDIVNFDSGGSAAIVIDEQMLNVPGRGSVRPVADAMLAVSLAPDDEVTHHLTFSVPYISPSVISRTPLRVMSFNQYDEVLENNLSGCTFEVVPPELGYVDDDAVYHSSTVIGAGKIIAKKDGMTAELRVTNLKIADISPRYTNLFIDNHRNYIIEIEGKSSTGAVAVDPGAFTWATNPEGIVEISPDGVMRGIANGSTVVTGIYDDLRFDLDVTVETNTPCITQIDFSDLNALAFSAPSAVKNLNISYSGLPEGFEKGAVLDFDLSSSRGAVIKMSPEMRMYSLPDSLGLHFTDRNGAVKNVQVQLVDALGERITITRDAVQGEQTVVFPMVDEDGNIFATGRYPLTLRTLSVYLNNSSLPGAQIVLGNLDAYYPGYVSAVEDVEYAPNAAQTINAQVYGETLYLTCPGISNCDARICIYDTTGAKRLDTVVCFEGSHAEVDIKMLPVGLYVVRAANARYNASTKLIHR